jgi:hypothetical protein
VRGEPIAGHRLARCEQPVERDRNPLLALIERGPGGDELVGERVCVGLRHLNPHLPDVHSSVIS